MGSIRSRIRNLHARRGEGAATTGSFGALAGWHAMSIPGWLDIPSRHKGNAKLTDSFFEKPILNFSYEYPCQWYLAGYDLEIRKGDKYA